MSTEEWTANIIHERTQHGQLKNDNLCISCDDNNDNDNDVHSPRMI